MLKTITYTLWAVYEKDGTRVATFDAQPSSNEIAYHKKYGRYIVPMHGTIEVEVRRYVVEDDNYEMKCAQEGGPSYIQYPWRIRDNVTLEIVAQVSGTRETAQAIADIYSANDYFKQSEEG